MQPQSVTVRSVYDAAPFRMRAGRRWTKDPRTVEIVDVVTDADKQITPSEFAALQADRYLAVSTTGGTDPKIPELKAALAEAEARVNALRAELEQSRAERESLAGRWSERERELGERIMKLESDNAASRDVLSEKIRKR